MAVTSPSDNLDQTRPFASVSMVKNNKRSPRIPANTARRVTNLINVNYLSRLNTRDRWLTIELESAVYVTIHKGSSTGGDLVSAAEFKSALGDYIRIDLGR